MVFPGPNRSLSEGTAKSGFLFWTAHSSFAIMIALMLFRHWLRGEIFRFPPGDGLTKLGMSSRPASTRHPKRKKRVMTVSRFIWSSPGWLKPFHMDRDPLKIHALTLHPNLKLGERL